MRGGKRFKRPKEEENILKLPPEISLDILSRLPAQTVVHCSTVCKAWRTLLLDPCFPQIHLANAKSSVSLMLYRSWPIYYHRFIEFEKNFRKRKMSKFHNKSKSPYEVVGSCNGLLCLSSMGLKRCFYVWNPIKRECITLPMPNIQRRMFAPILPYHPYDSIFSGFGFCPKTNVYKVIVATTRNEPSNKAMCEVCTFGTNAWIAIEDVPVPCRSVLKMPLNGALHWLCHSEIGGEKNFPLWVCALRIEDDMWDPILLPLPLLQAPHHHGLAMWSELGVLENCLAMFDKSEDYLLDIWMMKEYGVRESWTKCWSIESKIPSELPVRSLLPLKLTNDGDELLMFDNLNKALVCFNPGKGLITRKQRIHGISKGYEGIAHVGSFISPTEIFKELARKQLVIYENLKALI